MASKEQMVREEAPKSAIFAALKALDAFPVMPQAVRERQERSRLSQAARKAPSSAAHRMVMEISQATDSGMQSPISAVVTSPNPWELGPPPDHPSGARLGEERRRVALKQRLVAELALQLQARVNTQLALRRQELRRDRPPVAPVVAPATPGAEALAGLTLPELLKRVFPEPLEEPVEKASPEVPPLDLPVAIANDVKPPEPSEPPEVNKEEEEEKARKAEHTLAVIQEMNVRAQRRGKMVEANSLDLVRINRLKGVPNFNRGIFAGLEKKQGRSGRWFGLDEGDRVPSWRVMGLHAGLGKWMRSFLPLRIRRPRSSSLETREEDEESEEARSFRSPTFKVLRINPYSSLSQWETCMISTEEMVHRNARQSMYRLTPEANDTESQFSDLMGSISLLIEEQYGRDLTEEQREEAKRRVAMYRARKKMERAYGPVLPPLPRSRDGELEKPIEGGKGFSSASAMKAGTYDRSRLAAREAYWRRVDRFRKTGRYEQSIESEDGYELTREGRAFRRGKDGERLRYPDADEEEESEVERSEGFLQSLGSDASEGARRRRRDQKAAHAASGMERKAGVEDSVERAWVSSTADQDGGVKDAEGARKGRPRAHTGDKGSDLSSEEEEYAAGERPVSRQSREQHEDRRRAGQKSLGEGEGDQGPSGSSSSRTSLTSQTKHGRRKEKGGFDRDSPSLMPPGENEDESESSPLLSGEDAAEKGSGKKKGAGEGGEGKEDASLFTAESGVDSGRTIPSIPSHRNEKEVAKLNAFASKFPDAEAHVTLRRQANEVLSEFDLLAMTFSPVKPSNEDTTAEADMLSSSSSLLPSVHEKPVKGFLIDEKFLIARFKKELEEDQRELTHQRNRLRAEVKRQKELLESFQHDIDYLSFGCEDMSGEEYAADLMRLVNNYARRHGLTLNELEVKQEEQAVDVLGDSPRPNSGRAKVGDGFLNQFSALRRVGRRSVACQVNEEDLGVVDESARVAERHMEDLLFHERALLDAVRMATVAMANIMSFHASLELEATCKECFFILDHPRTLWPCGHTFCKHCIATMYNSREEIVCSECGTVCDVGYTPNHSIEVVAHYQVVQDSEYGNTPKSHGSKLTIESVLRRFLRDLIEL